MESGMKPLVWYAASFLAGLLIGVGVTLFVAPKSGQELRDQLRSEAEADMQRARGEWNARMEELQSAIDRAKTELADQVTTMSQKLEQRAQDMRPS